MRAVRYHQYGSPEVLRVEDVPEPHAPPGAVRIRTESVSVNPIDWKLRAGFAREMSGLELPIIPGRDAAGVVDEVGQGVTGVQVGDVVFGLGGTQDTYAQYAVLTAWATVPDSWTMDEAASAGLASATALGALAALGSIDGRTLLVEGAAGAVGAAVVAFAVDHGAQVVGTARPADHVFLREMGATPISYGPGLRERVTEVAPDGVDVAIDTAASGSLADLVEITGSKERVVTVADYDRALQLGVAHVWAENDSKLLEAAADLGARGRYTPRVARQFTAADVIEAHRAAEAGSTGGKLVITGL